MYRMTLNYTFSDAYLPSIFLLRYATNPSIAMLTVESVLLIVRSEGPELNVKFMNSIMGEAEM